MYYLKMQYSLALINQVAHHPLMGVLRVLLPTPTQETKTNLQHRKQKLVVKRWNEIEVISNSCLCMELMRWIRGMCNTYILYYIVFYAVVSSLLSDALCNSMWLCGSGNMFSVRCSHISCTVSLLNPVYAYHLHWKLALHQEEDHMDRSHFSLATGF